MNAMTRSLLFFVVLGLAQCVMYRGVEVEHDRPVLGRRLVRGGLFASLLCVASIPLLARIP
jgi:hypothetical protein